MKDKVVDISKGRKKTGKKEKLLGLFLLAVTICILLMSPFFSIQSINVTGNLNLSENIIIEASGIYYGQNIFRMNKNVAKNEISKLPYVKEVTIRRNLPNSISIFIKEKEAVSQTSFYGAKIIMADDGYVLRVVTDDSETNLINLEGLLVTDVTTGKFVECLEKEKMESFLEVLNILKKNDMLNVVVKLEEKNGMLVYLKDGNVANLGDTSNLQYKILLLKEIIPREKNTAYIDLTNLETKITRPVWGMIDTENTTNDDVNNEDITRGDTDEKQES